MTVYDYKNNATTLTTGALTATVGSMTVGVTTGSGLNFIPATGKVIVATLSNSAETLFEIVYITARSTDTLTITRAQDGTAAQVWAIGTKLQARLTKEMLQNLDPVKDANEHVLIGEGASVGGIRNVVIGRSASSVGDNSVAVGYDADIDATSDGAVAVGSNADITTSANAVSVGTSNTLSASVGAVVVGTGSAATSSAGAVAIGSNADVISAASAIAIGENATAASGASEAVVVGVGALAKAAAGVALGPIAKTHLYGGIALGVQARSYAQQGMALGSFAEVFVDNGLKVYAMPVVQRDQGEWYYPQTEPNYLASWPVVISSPPVDLGVPPVWSATTFSDGDVISASPANGTKQHYLVTNTSSEVAQESYDTTPGSVLNTVTEATQPAWVVTDQGDTTASLADATSLWHYIDPAVGIDIAVTTVGGASGQVMFYPKRVGFVVQKWTTGSNPTISVGNESNATAYVNAQALNGAGGQHYFKWFDVLEGVAAQRLIFKVASAGSGRCMGRFLVEGVYVQLPG